MGDNTIGRIYFEDFSVYKGMLNNKVENGEGVVYFLSGKFTSGKYVKGQKNGNHYVISESGEESTETNVLGILSPHSQKAS